MALYVIAASMAGCAGVKKPAEKLCAGKANAAEAFAALGAGSQATRAFKTSGNAVYHYPEDGRMKSEPVRIIMQIAGPERMSVVGNSVIGRVVQMGANADEFWLALRPKEISRYYWGQWGSENEASRSVRACVEKLWLGPATWYEALGVIDANSGPVGEWKLSSAGSYDVLEKTDAAGAFIKRVYIYNCDYTVHEIDYYDARGLVSAVTLMEDYVPVKGGGAWKVPTKLRLITQAKTPDEQSLDIEFKNPSAAEFTATQEELLFKRPSAQGFEHVLKMGTNCEFIEMR